MKSGGFLQMIGCFYGITTLNSAIEVFGFPFISSMGSNFKYLVSKTFPNVTN